jgi:hypothetical protein
MYGYNDMSLLRASVTRKANLLVFLATFGATWALWPASVFSHENITTTVLYDREIVRILNNKCVACHVENGLAFPLTTYAQTRPWADAIKEQTLRRAMPPWRAVTGYGQFANEIGLTIRESQFIVAWVEGNGPKSADQTAFTNIANLSLADDGPILKPDVDRWKLGTPDLVRPLGSGSVTADEKGVKRVVIDLGLTSDQWVHGLEFKPGHGAAVRAAFFSLQETGQWLGSWTPWYGFTNLPDGSAYRVPAGSHIVGEIHSGGTGKSEDGSGSLGLYFTRARRPSNVPVDLVMQASGDGTPSVTGQRFRAATTLTSDTSVVSLRPELHDGVQSIEVAAKAPDGHVEELLFVKDILVEWPTPYILKEPVFLPRGTELSVTSYDRTASSKAAHPAGVKVTISCVINQSARSAAR